MDEAEEKLQQIFVPTHYSKWQDLAKTNGKLVYYTSADTALRILKNEEVWMRSTMTMNDYQEVAHGFHGLDDALTNEPGIALKAELEKYHPGVFDGVIEQTKQSLGRLRYGSYITCLSRHAPTENKYGRLSMWRAYGAPNSVALVLNNGPFISVDDTLGAFSAAVDYMDVDEYGAHIQSLTERIAAEGDFIRATDPEELIGRLRYTFGAAMLCTKHPAFKEEREWRVFHTPGEDPIGKLTTSLESIGGIPQRVFKIPLKAFPGTPLDTSIPTLLDRIIIGPCLMPITIADAFLGVLTDKGVVDPHSKIHISGVPLR